jgi:hypothetical protein
LFQLSSVIFCYYYINFSSLQFFHIAALFLWSYYLYLKPLLSEMASVLHNFIGGGVFCQSQPLWFIAIKSGLKIKRQHTLNFLVSIYPVVLSHYDSICIVC